MIRSRPPLCLAGIALAALGYVGVMIRRSQGIAGMFSYDVYGAHFPNIVYALRSVRDGHGLLWNPFQNCGEPFLPGTLLGPFYPLHALFGLIDTNHGMFLLAGIHLAIGGLGAYLLCRQVGLTLPAALCGAFAFEIGTPATALAAWMPTSILGVYVWLPWAAFLCERILEAPRIGRGVALGVVLTLQLLAGYPQVLLFTYQVLALRVLWELATRRPPRPVATLTTMALALGLPLPLGAVQLLPMLEFARQSVRGRALALNEITPLGWSWHTFVDAATRRTPLYGGTTLVVVTAALAAVGLFFAAERRRIVLFYGLVAVLFFAVSFDPLLAWYRHLPFGSLFREPERFLWVSGFAVTVVVAAGADAMLRARPRRTADGVLVVAVAAVGVALLRRLTGPLFQWEWVLLGATACVGAAAWLGRGRGVAQIALPALVLVNLFFVNGNAFLIMMPDTSRMFAHAALFDFLRERMTPQDRLYLAGGHYDYGLTAKSASMFGVRSIGDYEPQTPLRYAELYVRLLSGQPMTNINQLYFLPHPMPRSRTLLNLLATRYLVADLEGADLAGVTPPFGVGPPATSGPPLRHVRDIDGVTVFENTEALPRAFWVPRLEVVPDANALVARLASDAHDPRKVALVESAPADGFLGGPGDGDGRVTIESDLSETVTLRVEATHPGFAVLSDQAYPGWEVAINGAPGTILRANHAFRAVRVDAGSSVVVFRYRPASVRWGALISAATLAGLVAAWLGSRRATTVAPA